MRIKKIMSHLLLNKYLFIIKAGSRNLIQILTFTMVCTACTAKKDFTAQRWDNEGTAPAVPSYLNVSENKSVTMQSQVITHQQQRIDGILIEGGYYKSIQKSNGSLTYLNYSLLENLPAKASNTKARMLRQQDGIVARIKSKHKIFNNMNFSNQVDFIWTAKNQLLWRLEYSDTQNQYFAVHLNEGLSIIKTIRLSSSFTSQDPIGSVFPQGPLKSTLQNVRLKNLTGQKNLSSENLKILTKSENLATSDSGQFVFDLADERLKQVQVYFDLNESFDWFETQFQFRFPAVVTVETSMGYPLKTSAAFYYKNKISLGDGDGEAYKDMALDPSITKHESVHAVTDAISSLVNEGETASINEALADYFTAAQLNNPKMGEASYQKADAKRNISNAMVMSDKKGATYHDSLIVSGLLWELRGQLGAETADLLTWNILKRLHSYAEFSDFKTELKAEINLLPADSQALANAIAQRRGWLDL
jgi:Zn-dependent metalloprotease